MSPGDRVQCLPGALPRDLGQPLGEVLSVGPVAARVRLFCDSSERRIRRELLRVIPGSTLPPDDVDPFEAQRAACNACDGSCGVCPYGGRFV